MIKKTLPSIAAGNAEATLKLMDDHLQPIETKLDLTEYNQPVDLQEMFFLHCFITPK
jgi:hypothetical protein